MDSKRKKLTLAAIILLLIASVLGGYLTSKLRRPPDEAIIGDLKTSSKKADAKGTKVPGLTMDARGTVPAEVVAALSDAPAEAPIARLGRSWSSGPIVITPEDLTYTIARDYDQRVEIGLANRGQVPLEIVASVGETSGGLLSGFVGLGGNERPLTLSAGESVKISLYFFAQDATRPAYHTHVAVRARASGELLAASPLRILMPLPEFDVDTVLGQPESGTLAQPVTLSNKGGRLTDVTVLADDDLQGRVYFQPTVEHAYLDHGTDLKFSVVPRLTAGFTSLDGHILVQAAGQSKRVALRIATPPGQRVFVASSFTTSSFSGLAWYCTNRPNVDTSLGGPSDGILHPISAGNPYLPQGLWATQWGNIGPIRFRTIWGPSPLGVGGGAGSGASGSRGPHRILPLGLGLHDTAIDYFPVATDPSVQPGDSASTGDEPRVDDPDTIEHRAQGGQQHGPRGLRMRAAYARFRPHIYDENKAEAMLAYSGGPVKSRAIYQAWHTNAHGAKGRQIVFKAWDGRGQQALTKDLGISPPDRFGQWPAVAVMPGGGALVVWEDRAEDGQPPSLAYRVSEPGFGTWSEVQAVPIAAGDGKVGHYDPVAVVMPDGHVVLMWQRGTGRDSRIMISRTNADGELAQAVMPDLPTGAERPIPRVDDDGMLHLVFQAPAADSGEIGTAVYYTASRDGGTTFGPLSRLSPLGTDAGEPDMLIHQEAVQVVFRAGADWASRVMYAVQPAGQQSWPPAVPITAETLYAEFPSLVPLKDGVRVEFYGDLRETAAGPLANRDPQAVKELPLRSMIRRYRVSLRDQQWTEPERLLTRFPAAAAGWLQVGFRLRTDRSDYRPHEVALLLNGHELFAQADAVPEGTFLLPFDPSILRVDGHGVPRNVIGVRTRHMNSAHYSSATDFRLQTRHTFLERLVVAKIQADADRVMAAETAQANHARHDLGLFAVLPLEPLKTASQIGEKITIPVLLGNLGEVVAQDITVDVYEGHADTSDPPTGAKVGETLSIDRVDPRAEFRKLQVTFPFGGKGSYSIVARAADEDFDLANNVHAVSFVVPKPAPVAPRESATGDSFAVSLDDDPRPPYLCRLLDEGGREVARTDGGRLDVKLPGGKYRLALTRFQFEGQEVVFPELLEHRSNQPLRPVIRTAVELDLPDRLPHLYRWEVVQADKPDEIVQWHSGQHLVMHVPPGSYRVAFQPTQFDTKRVVWPDIVHVGRDEHVTVRLNSGLKLQTARQVQDLWRWEVARADRPDEVVQGQRGDMLEMLLPPADYVVILRRTQFHSSPLQWTGAFSVKAGEFAPARIDSGVWLSVTPGLEALYSWEVASTEKPYQTLCEYSQDQARARVMPVPPGDYFVAIQPSQFQSQRVVWNEKLHVKAGEFITARIASGVRLELAKEAGDLYLWKIVADDDPSRIVSAFWHGQAQQRSMLVPPGEYRLAVQRSQFNSDELLWPAKLQVRAGEFVTTKLDCGIQLELPKDAGEIYQWGVVVADKSERLIASYWHGMAKERSIIVPPGEYHVFVTPSQFNSQRLVWPETLRVEAGKFTSAALLSGIRLIGAKDAKADFDIRFMKDGREVQWARKTWSMQVLPPGMYKIEMRRKSTDDWRPLTDNVEVEAGKIKEVEFAW